MTKLTLTSGIALASSTVMITTSAALGQHPQVTKHSAVNDVAVLDRIAFAWKSGQRLAYKMSTKGKRIKAIIQTFAPDAEPSQTTIAQMKALYGTEISVKDRELTLETPVDIKLTDVATVQPFVAKIIDTLQDPRLPIGGETDHYDRIQPFMTELLQLSTPLQSLKMPKLGKATKVPGKAPAKTTADA